MNNKERVQYILSEMKLLDPNEKGLLFNMFFAQEKKMMKGSRKKYFGSVKVDREITDQDIESGLYKPNADDILKD